MSQTVVVVILAAAMIGGLICRFTIGCERDE